MNRIRNVIDSVVVQLLVKVIAPVLTAVLGSGTAVSCYQVEAKPPPERTFFVEPIRDLWGLEEDWIFCPGDPECPKEPIPIPEPEADFGFRGDPPIVVAQNDDDDDGKWIKRPPK